MNVRALLERIDRQVIAVNSATRECVEVGPFVAMFDPSTEIFYANYAVPSREAATNDEVRSLIEVFGSRNRMPRLEFRREAQPALSAMLEAAGFTLESQHPVMVCMPTDFVPHDSPAVEVQMLGHDDDILPFLRVADEAFGMVGPIDKARVEHTRAALDSGAWIAALGTIDGHPAGCAVLTPHEGIAELAGVGTADAFRRRGVASTVSSALMHCFFDGGDAVWLSAGDDTAEAVYRRLGFKRVATQANYSLGA